MLPKKNSSTVINVSESLKEAIVADTAEEGGKEKRVLECLVTDQESSQTKDQEDVDTGRERLKRHRIEMAGRVWIPEIWGQESFLKDWIDCAAFDTSLVPKGLVSARDSLVEECRRANSGGLQIENRC
ncbi:hypothetical protein J5N97_021377 [Dioscorea zingiberensis]|uniref:Protein BIC1 n=1 Tax=Dioscorea zingiberensis TaxID=325984 RepID=A0A9D5CJ09_9LILI|nr:hypothetical protein J5N97_021377 [Dioscorea zingiberensis]